MVQRLEKITASGTHPSPYGEVASLDPDRSLADAPGLGFWRSIRTPLALFFIGLVVFCLFTFDRLGRQSTDPHFIYLADAFLHGQLELTRHPPPGHDNDWARYIETELPGGEVVRGVWYDREAGKFLTLSGEMYLVDQADQRRLREQRHYYVSFPPGPAVLMMPGVAIWGYGFNDIWFTLFFAALNLPLMYLVLRRISRGGRSERSHQENLWLVFLFGFGTTYLWCSILGQVWFTALIVGITFTLLYLLCALDARHPLLAGLFLACGFATRTPLIWSALLFFAFLFFPGGRWRRSDWGRTLFKLAQFCLFPLVIGIALLYMNHARFESWFEFGHRYLAEGRLTHIRDYGLFNYHFLGRNLAAAFALVPRLQLHPPYVLISRHGMSLFLTTPVWFYLFKNRPRLYRQDVFWFRLLWLVVFLMAVLHFFYQNTGWEQFGYRFSLDYTPYLIVLLAIGRYPLTVLFKVLVVVGFLVNAFGAVTFKRMGMFYTDWFFDP
ncbi:MAG: hypothetical protein JW797_11225 [Bradymonadales bacterium]|nr:hypothetical protein [Bradymonadales bacterium]